MQASFNVADFERVALRLRPRLVSAASVWLGSGADADDAVQDTMLKLWFFRDRLSEYETVDAPAMVILRRACLNMLRSRNRSPLTSTLTLPDTPEASDHSGEGLSDEMLDALNSLPCVEQAVLRLKHLEGMEVDEIAALIHSTPGTVRTALSRARRRVRDHFTQLYNRDT